MRELGEPDINESDARRRMRALFEQQLDLARDLARQQEKANGRRSRLEELLKTLWMQTASLRAHHHEAAFDSSQVSGRIKAITDDAKRYLEAARETDTLLGPSG